MKIFPHRELNVFQDCKRGEHRTLLKQDTPAPFKGASLFGSCRVAINAHDLDMALPFRNQTDDCAK